jgi:hypothetical protein
MAICIAAPVAGSILFSLNRFGTINIGGNLPYLLFLLCSLSHFVMVTLMGKLEGGDKDKVLDEGERRPSCRRLTEKIFCAI